MGENTLNIMPDVLAKATSWLSLLPRISLRNIWEIIIISVLVYEILVWIKNTRAWNLLKGLLVILGFYIIAAVLQLSTILWILRNFTTIAVTALLVVFQPELRKALEQLGSRNFLSDILSFDDGKDNLGFNDKTVNELTRAAFEMAKVKTGALIVIERGSSLKEIERTGIEINGLVTSQLLINIFEHNTPLHDGAVVVRGNRIAAATCYLPLSDNMTISKDLGTRHRAAVGVSETSDSLTIVVSEETGRVSVASGGTLIKVSNAEGLKEILSGAKEENVSSNRFKIWKGRLMNGKKADE
jgi:diadenylate cyclase